MFWAHNKKHQKYMLLPGLGLTPVILALGMLHLEECQEFEVSPAYMHTEHLGGVSGLQKPLRKMKQTKS